MRNQELSIKIKPINSASNILYEPDFIFKDVKQYLEKKYPHELLIDSQEKVGIDFFTKKMLNNENFTFVKYGDGEILCMIGGKGENCDHHPYSEKLKKELEKSFVKLLRLYDDVYLAEWVDNLVKTRESYVNVNGLKPKFADYECFLTLKENLNDKKLLNFYTLLKKTKRKKIFVGPKKLKRVTTMLGIDNFVEVPIINAFSDYDRVMDELVHIEVNDNNIYILCCSMMSCLICSDLKEINKKITLLDVGSGLDPIFGERTRPKQPSEEECFEYFRDLLPKNHNFEKKQKAVTMLNNSAPGF
ncbi:MAG: hypothetical protein CMM92_07115 [Rickettsiales bacterium]|nr:hypothetical protein [Rickettsiales bacterium]|tara:strand:- start:2059 stop:2964 length:906 start_codon:yes stop_codon:yes gene_type:complete